MGRSGYCTFTAVLQYKSDEDTSQSIAGGTCIDLLTSGGRGKRFKDTARIYTSCTLAKYC